jgi:hypothetical protein
MDERHWVHALFDGCCSAILPRIISVSLPELAPCRVSTRAMAPNNRSACHS